MKTPVEWLFEQLWDTPKDKFEWYLLRAQAMEMEKEQIIEANLKGLTYPFVELDAAIKAEQYYNETYDK